MDTFGIRPKNTFGFNTKFYFYFGFNIEKLSYIYTFGSWNVL